MRTDKKKKHRINKKKFSIFIAAIVLIAIAAVLFYPEELEGQTLIFPEDEVFTSLSIRCVGDIMTHAPQTNAAYQNDGTFYEYSAKSSYSTIRTDGTFDFSSVFEYVTEYFNEADLMLGNIETTFSGDGTYSGYPGFDAPDALATDLKEAGLDVALFANNHMLDTKLAGAKRTVQVLSDAGLAVVGCRVDTDQSRSIIIEEKGVNIGIVAYTYETALVNGLRTMNGSSGSGMNAGAPDYINTFRYYNIDEDRQTMADEISWCRENGADIVICYLHWGNEYSSITKTDRATAQYLAENGADIIFASHPHILQSIEEIQVEVDYPEEWVSDEWPKLTEMPERTWLQKIKIKLGILKEPEVPEYTMVERPTTWTKTVPVFYSMGNFVSNQRTESLGETYGVETAAKTEQGMIACVDLSYCKETGEIRYDAINCIPTWVDRYTKNGRLNYSIIPLDDNISNNSTLSYSGHTSRAKEALSSITALLGSQYIR